MKEKNTRHSKYMRWIEFFEDDNGRLSMMRLLSFFTFFIMLFVIIFQLIQGYHYFNLILAKTDIKNMTDIQYIHVLFGNFVNTELILMLLIAAFIPKALQKMIEVFITIRRGMIGIISNKNQSIDNDNQSTEENNNQNHNDLVI